MDTGPLEASFLNRAIALASLAEGKLCLGSTQKIQLLCYRLATGMIKGIAIQDKKTQLHPEKGAGRLSERHGNVRGQAQSTFFLRGGYWLMHPSGMQQEVPSGARV